MNKLAIIGGSGFSNLTALQVIREEAVATPFGEPSGPLVHGVMGGREIIFLARHSPAHTIPPHQINYRANLWAIHSVGATKVIGIAAVGGITNNMQPLTIVIPDQIIDYTYGRSHTIFEQGFNNRLAKVTHIDFSYPYCEELRQLLLIAAKLSNEVAIATATYGATQGPRLETAKEVQRMEQDGCDIIGMTGMPEAALARELGLCYASCALVVNWAAGKSPGTVEMTEIEQNLTLGMQRIERLLTSLAGCIKD